nr:TPA: hypothetical protein BN1204_033740 [Neospora caninum Liverpool]
MAADWTDAELLAAAAHAARQDFLGAQRARGAGDTWSAPRTGRGEGLGDIGAAGSARGSVASPRPAEQGAAGEDCRQEAVRRGGVPFLLVRNQLIRLLDDLGCGLQSERGLQVYRLLLQHVVDATVGEAGRDLFLFPEDNRARVFRPPFAPDSDEGGAALGVAGSALQTSFRNSHSVAISSLASAPASSSRGPLAHPRGSVYEATAGTSVARSASSGVVASAASSSASCLVARVEVFAGKRKEQEHRRLLAVFREWKNSTDRAVRLRSLFWVFRSRQRLWELRRSLSLWRAKSVEARDQRESGKNAAADHQRAGVLCRRGFHAWRTGVGIQKEEEAAQTGQCTGALRAVFQSWREEAVALRRDVERKGQLSRVFAAWRKSHLVRQAKKKALEERRLLAQGAFGARRMQAVWTHWRERAAARSLEAERLCATLERSRLRRALEALQAETHDRQERRGAAAAAAEETVRERLLARVFRGWQKATILRRPPFAASHSQFSAPQVVCLLKAVSALRPEAGGGDAGHARSVGEALLDAAAARKRRACTRDGEGRRKREGEDAEAGGKTEVELKDAALLTLIPLHGVDLHLPKLTAAGPLMAQCLRQHYQRHAFLQWRSFVLRQRHFREGVRVARVARAFRAWRQVVQRTKNDDAKRGAVAVLSEKRILKEAWQAWRMRWRRYVLFRTQCRNLQDLRLFHLKALAFRSWGRFHSARQRETQRIAAVKARHAAVLQQAALKSWKEAWHLRRRRRAMEEAAGLLREKTLLAKGLRGLKRQRTSSRTLRAAAAALKQERLGLSLAVWWRWGARRGAFQELCALQREKGSRRRLQRLFRAWRQLSECMQKRRDAARRLAAAIDRARLRQGLRAWRAMNMQQTRREDAADRLQRTVNAVLVRSAWATWVRAQTLACREEEMKKNIERKTLHNFVKRWQAAATEHATVQLHLRGQLLCSRLSRLLHRWQRLATLSRLGLLQKSRSRLFLLRRCQQAWLTRLAEKNKERQKEARADSLCRAFRLRTVQGCLLAWRETATAVAARRRKGDTFLAHLQRARLGEAWEAWRSGVQQKQTKKRLLLRVAEIQEKCLVARVLVDWRDVTDDLRKEELAAQERRQSLLRRAVGAWKIWRRRRAEKKEVADRVRDVLNREGSAKREGEKRRGKETLAAWHALTVKRVEVRCAFSRVGSVADSLSLRRGFAAWRLWARQLACLSRATSRLASWRRNCLLRVSFEALQEHRERVKEMELASLSHFSILRQQTRRLVFLSWRSRFLALRREAEVAARRRHDAVKAETHAALACKRKCFLSWLKALAAKLELRQRIFVLLKKRREALESKVLRGWRKLVKKKEDLRESLELFSGCRRSQCLRRVFSALFATVSRQRLVRARFLFFLGLLSPSPDFSVSSTPPSPSTRSLLLPLSPLAAEEEASLRLLWGSALPAPQVVSAASPCPRRTGDAHTPDGDEESATADREKRRESPNVLAALPLVPRLIVWSAQPHMLHLLLLQPGIADTLARQAAARSGEPVFARLPAARARRQTREGERPHQRFPLFLDEAAARGRCSGSAVWGEETLDGSGGDRAFPGWALPSGSRPASSWGGLTPSTCTPHTTRTNLSVPLSGYGRAVPSGARTREAEQDDSASLFTASSHFRTHSASPFHSDGRQEAVRGRRHRSETKGREETDAGEDLLLADKKSSESLERLLRCFSTAARRGPGLAEHEAEMEEDAYAVSVSCVRPQNDLQALLLAQVNRPLERKSHRVASLFLPSTPPVPGAVSDGLDSSQETVESAQSEGSVGGLSGHSEERRAPASPSKNWREEIPVDLLASAWKFVRLLQAALRAWSLRARSRKARCLREAGLVAAFGARSRARLLRVCWNLWRGANAQLEEQTRQTTRRVACGVQRRVLRAWHVCATVEASVAMRAKAFADAALRIKAKARLEAWREIAAKRRQEREQVEAWRQRRDLDRKKELFTLWTHLAAVNRAGAQLYVHRKEATLSRVFATWKRETLRSQAINKIQMIFSRPGLFLGFSQLRIWSLMRACSLRLAGHCLDSWKQHTQRRKRLAELLVYIQTLNKVSRLQQHFSAWLLVQQRRRRLLLLQRTAEAAAFLLPLHRVFSRWRAAAVERQADRDRRLHQFVAQRRAPFQPDAGSLGRSRDAGGDSRVPESRYAYWARWRVEETWQIWRRRFRLRTLLRRQATRCARSCFAALRQAVERRRAFEAFEHQRRRHLLQRATVAWQVYVQRRLLKQQRMAHAIERYNLHTLRQTFGRYRWILQRLQWERGVIEVSQAKANRRICRKALQALYAYAESRVSERQRLDDFHAARASRLLRQHVQQWIFLYRATRHSAALLCKTSFLLWRQAYRRSRGAQLLLAVQAQIDEKQMRRGLASLKEESDAFEEMRALGEETPWLKEALEAKIGAARDSLVFALSSLRTFAAHRVSRRRQARLLAAALGAWARLQETEGPRRRLRPCLLHWRGALQYRLHLQAAEEALRRHVEFRRQRQVWGEWRHLQREEVRGRELLGLAETTKKVWALEKGLLLLHEHRLQREWMAWCTYRAEVFITEQRQETARVCARGWHLWAVARGELRRRGAAAEEVSRRSALSMAFNALRRLYTRRTTLRHTGEFLVDKTERNTLRTAWRGWRKVLMDLLALKPRLEALLARQAFQRVCLAWSGWRTWHLTREERRQRLAPLTEKARAVRGFRLIFGCFHGWAELAEERWKHWLQKEGLVEKRVERRLKKETFRAWLMCAREIHFVRSTKAAAANAAALAVAGPRVRALSSPSGPVRRRRSRSPPRDEISPLSSPSTASRRSSHAERRTHATKSRDLLASSLSLSGSQLLARASEESGPEADEHRHSEESEEGATPRPPLRRGPSQASLSPRRERLGDPGARRQGRIVGASGNDGNGDVRRLVRSYAGRSRSDSENAESEVERTLRRRSASSAVYETRRGESRFRERNARHVEREAGRDFKGESRRGKGGRDPGGRGTPQRRPEAPLGAGRSTPSGNRGVAVSFSLASSSHQGGPNAGTPRVRSRVSTSLSASSLSASSPSPTSRRPHAMERAAGGSSSPSSASLLRAPPRQLRLRDLLSDSSSSSLASRQQRVSAQPRALPGLASPGDLTAVAVSLLDGLSRSRSSLAEAARALLLRSGRDARLLRSRSSSDERRGEGSAASGRSSSLPGSGSGPSSRLSSGGSEAGETVGETRDETAYSGSNRGQRQPEEPEKASFRGARKRERETGRQQTEDEGEEGSEGRSGVEVAVERNVKERVRSFPRTIREAPASAFDLPASLSSLLTSLQGRLSASPTNRVRKTEAGARDANRPRQADARGGDERAEEQEEEEEGREEERAEGRPLVAGRQFGKGSEPEEPRPGERKRDHPFFFSLMSPPSSLVDQEDRGQSSFSSSPASPSSVSSLFRAQPPAFRTVRETHPSLAENRDKVHAGAGSPAVSRSPAPASELKGAELTEKLRRIVERAAHASLQRQEAEDEIQGEEEIGEDEDTEEADGTTEEERVQRGHEREDAPRQPSRTPWEGDREGGALGALPCPLESSTLSSTLLLSELAPLLEEEAGEFVGAHVPAPRDAEPDRASWGVGENAEVNDPPSDRGRESAGSLSSRTSAYPFHAFPTRGALPPISESQNETSSSLSPEAPGALEASTDRLAVSTRSEVAVELADDAEEPGDTEAELRKLLARLERLEGLHRSEVLSEAPEERQSLLEVPKSALNFEATHAAVQQRQRDRLGLAARTQSPSPPVSPLSSPHGRGRHAGDSPATPETSLSSSVGTEQAFRRDPHANQETERREESQHGQRREDERGTAEEDEDRGTEEEEEDRGTEEDEEDRGREEDERVRDAGEDDVERSKREEEWLEEIVAVSRRKAREVLEREQRVERQGDENKETASVASSEELLEEAWKEAREETRNALLEIHREMKGVAIFAGEERETVGP